MSQPLEDAFQEIIAGSPIENIDPALINWARELFFAGAAAVAVVAMESHGKYVADLTPIFKEVAMHGQRKMSERN